MSPVAGQTYSTLMLALRRARRSDDAHELFLAATGRASVAPPAAVVATAIGSLAIEDCVEQAFLVHDRLRSETVAPERRLEPSPAVHGALIQAASRRKEYFGRALALFQEMSALGMPIGAGVYSDMLYACSKASALTTAMALWREALGCKESPPTRATATNYLWALAAVESPRHSLRFSKHRAFFWDDVTPAQLSAAASDVVAWAEKNGIRPNAHMLVALLAVHTNHRLRGAAEDIFWTRMWGASSAMQHQPFGHEHMLLMYDRVRDYGAALEVYRHYRRVFVDEPSGRARARLPYEGWRALARTAALTGHLDEALGHVSAMRAEQGHVPAFEDFRAVHLRMCEAGRPDLVSRLTEACRPRLPESGGDAASAGSPDPAPLAAASRRSVADLAGDGAGGRPSRAGWNAHVPYLERSRALSELLGRVYGRDAPRLATDPGRVPARKS